MAASVRLRTVPTSLTYRETMSVANGALAYPVSYTVMTSLLGKCGYHDDGGESARQEQSDRDMAREAELFQSDQPTSTEPMGEKWGHLRDKSMIQSCMSSHLSFSVFVVDRPEG